jgi:hypothetical protein
MENVLVASFTVVGAVWLLGLFLSVAALRNSVLRPPASETKALSLSLAAFLICGVGSLVGLFLDVSTSTQVEGESSPIDAGHWHIDSRWFFRPVMIVAAAALILAISRLRSPKMPNPSA